MEGHTLENCVYRKTLCSWTQNNCRTTGGV